jgi:hypothetical protein
MTPVTSMILRRIRVPLLVLITVYSVSIIGLVLTPGVDDQGNPYRVSIFQAFYFVIPRPRSVSVKSRTS